ncbi:hypothetical protein BHE97_12835 [Aeromicrobium sp. PE09-221]|uniref:hypothetical protein n=1 Tax=Aeromicrobium sp. PE09-221 TaxID=1898043 RepID=UPI000B3E48B9|nr:hypothetical protein [Aeromicrobium sp. PE09-221]OUZ08559.1 hypothetical protein BHE97_12835 [Aeromicrobium sp. PE09-221]
MTTASTPSRGLQRFIVLGALLALVTGLVTWVAGDADPAEANSQSNAHQPFDCSQPGTGNPQQRRQTIPLKSTSGNGFENRNSGTRMFPCLSGVQWRMTAGDPSTSDTGAIVADVRGINTQNAHTYYLAADGSRSLYQLAFRDLTFRPNVAQHGAPVLTADSRTAPDPRPAAGHTLTIKPDGPMTVGGPGVRTELIATGDSWFALPWSQITAMSFLANVVGKGAICTAGSSGDVCRIRLQTLAGGGSGLLGQLIAAIVSGLAQGGDFSIIAFDLTFDYLWTHDMDASRDPYVHPPGGANPLNSIRMPNTTIMVR